MGQCYARSIPVSDADNHTYTYTYTATSATSPVASYNNSHSHHNQSHPQSHHRHHGRSPRPGSKPATPSRASATSAAPSPWLSPLPPGIAPSPARSSTPRRFFRRPFPPPSPAKHIKASLAKRAPPTPDNQVPDVVPTVTVSGNSDAPLDGLDKSFGFGKNFGARYELGKEVGRGHFGHTSIARVKKGELKGQLVAVKIIPKSKMTSAIAIEDVRREVKMLKALSGHTHTVKFYDACEDGDNVYIVMELCEGGELLDRILSRGGRYTEEDAKTIIVQILNVVSFCHLQGVVHRDLKPENFLFSNKDENSALKIIDFGLSDFVRPDERLNDIVGSAYYVAPEVLHRSYSTEADMWSIGVITYILLCGSRPFWARTESGIFRSVLRADPNYDDTPWPSVSPEGKDFVRRFLNKDYRKRITAAQALTHPWLRDQHRKVPLDIFIYKLVKAYLRATPFKRAALKALSKAITEDEVIYIRSQYDLLEPSKDGRVSLDNFRSALLRNVTDAMKESRVHEILNGLEPLSYRKMDFEEFCAATISPYQLEALQDWEHIATTAFEYFELEGNRVIKIEELANEMNLSSSAYSIIRDWIRPSDGKLSFLGYAKFLHGVTIRSSNARRHH